MKALILIGSMSVAFPPSIEVGGELNPVERAKTVAAIQDCVLSAIPATAPTEKLTVAAKIGYHGRFSALEIKPKSDLAAALTDSMARCSFPAISGAEVPVRFDLKLPYEPDEEQRSRIVGNAILGNAEAWQYKVGSEKRFAPEKCCDGAVSLRLKVKQDGSVSVLDARGEGKVTQELVSFVAKKTERQVKVPAIPNTPYPFETTYQLQVK